MMILQIAKSASVAWVWNIIALKLSLDGTPDVYSSLFVILGCMY